MDSSLITKVVRSLSLPPAYAETGVRGSILTAAATSYGFRADLDELTQPTGFDPVAAQLFEALVERAVHDLPEEFQEAIDNVVVMVAEEPSDDDLEEVAISARVEHGVVTLSGVVPETELSERAEKLAESVPGVVSVQNRIQVAAEKPAAPAAP